MKKLLFMLPMALIFIFAISCDKENDNPSPNEKEGNGTEQGESGKLWNRIDDANETVNGVQLTLKFDEGSQSFKGELYNTNTNIAQQVRVEVHVYDAAGNSKEYGPTTPGDMDPGEKRTVVLATPNAGNFVKFAMHPELGANNSETGNEGGGESGGENHGNEGGNG